MALTPAGGLGHASLFRSIHAPDLVKRARRSARSESRQKSWRRQADRHIALTSEPSTARHAGGPPDRWLGWSDSACCLPSLQVRPEMLTLQWRVSRTVKGVR